MGGRPFFSVGTFHPLRPVARTQEALSERESCLVVADVLFDRAFGDTPTSAAVARAGRHLKALARRPGRLGWAASVLLDGPLHRDEWQDAVSVVLSVANQIDGRPPGERRSGLASQLTLPGLAP